MPIIAPVKVKKFEVEEREALPTRYSHDFLASLLATPELIRNVAVVGHLHHGKTLVSGTLFVAPPLNRSAVRVACDAAEVLRRQDAV